LSQEVVNLISDSELADSESEDSEKDCIEVGRWPKIVGLEQVFHNMEIGVEEDHEVAGDSDSSNESE